MWLAVGGGGAAAMGAAVVHTAQWDAGADPAAATRHHLSGEVKLSKAEVRRVTASANALFNAIDTDGSGGLSQVRHMLRHPRTAKLHLVIRGARTPPAGGSLLPSPESRMDAYHPCIRFHTGAVARQPTCYCSCSSPPSSSELFLSVKKRNGCCSCGA